MDKIILKQMAFYGYHGLFPQENHLGQRFYVDLEMYTDLKEAGQTDDMNASINYGTAYDVVKEIVEGEAKHLIEAVAETIADALFTEFNTLKRCVVKVSKPEAPIPGQFESVAVELDRERLK
ncbi:Dihydroneopterin aldolase [Lentibacillus sp. JNUCC-1]|uniref:dihydroneopterin aldolase n=1 Tax=Lentibacillus sp. JNUCC-1 TaxID=2654513 RepID=UPI0012E75185|nr:dihydroneopterin aldolase [Lentibacillus sp. JNUCC-1]MUV38048.1 Dihydroneopterin aldolase [Lentibacillus sp. JNUCC-1]